MCMCVSIDRGEENNEQEADRGDILKRQNEKMK